ncbi:hypothetical protein LCGC14_3013420 [marine sediment metagenome]|uniref:Uncharacterized protein n=1 Tax=marine sediment metagenome TaxID=412755 RepID=A0A0F8WXG8_9ZZZZ
MKSDTKASIGIAAVLTFVVGTAIYAHSRDETVRDKYRAKYAQCEYLGSRIEKGWGSIKIYRYDCDGAIEETPLKPVLEEET